MRSRYRRTYRRMMKKTKPVMKEVTTTFTRYGQPGITQTSQMYMVLTAWNHTDKSNVHGTDSLEPHRQIKCIWGQRDPQVDTSRENPQNIDCMLCGLISSFLALAVGKQKDQSTRNTPKSQRYKTRSMMVQLTLF